VDLVATQTPEGMHGILEKPDVDVTNKKDKEKMLPKILKYNEDVMQGIENGFKKPQSDQSPSQPNSGKPSHQKVSGGSFGGLHQ
jgi:hypothetical protein